MSFTFELREKTDKYEKVLQTDDLYRIFVGIMNSLSQPDGTLKLSGGTGSFEFGIEGGPQVCVRALTAGKSPS